MTNKPKSSGLLLIAGALFGLFFGGIAWRVAQDLLPGGNRLWIGIIVLLVFLSGAVTWYREERENNDKKRSAHHEILH